MLVSAKIIAYFAKTRSLSFLMCCFTNDTFSLPSPHSDQHIKMGIWQMTLCSSY